MEFEFSWDDLTITEQRTMKRATDEYQRAKRNVWIKAMKRKGISNVAIADAMDLTESTVRAILKKS